MQEFEKTKEELVSELDLLKKEHALLKSKYQRKLTEIKDSFQENSMLIQSLKSINDCVSITDLENNILFVNESFQKVYGYSIDELIGENISIVSSNEETSEFKNELLYSTITGGWSGELINKSKNGTVFPIYLSTSTIKDSDGKILGLIGVANDITKRKQLEEFNKINEERFRLAMSASREGLWDWRIEENQVYYSPSWSEILDEVDLPSEFITWERRINPDDLPICLATLTEHLKGKTEYWKYEHRLKMRNGNWKWVLGQGKVIVRDLEGNPLRMVGTMKDIAERKKAETELKKSKEEFQGYFEMGPVGMCVTSLEKGWVEVNDKLCQMLCYTKEELTKFTWAELTHPDDLNSDLELFNEVIEGKRDKYELDKRFIRKDGSTVYTTLSVTCQRNNDGTVRHFLAQLMNITERKLAENALKESEQRFAQLAEQNNTFTWEINTEGYFTYITPVVEKLLGYKPSEIINKLHFYDFQPEEDRDAVKDLVFGILARREPILNIQHRSKTKTGETVWINTNGMPILDKDGLLIGYNGNDADITKSKLAEAELEKHRNHLEELVRVRTEELERANESLKEVVEKEKELNEMKSRFVSTTSHEFRTPLTSVLSSTELLQRYSAKWDDIKKNEHFDRIQNSVEYLVKLLDEVLIISKTDSGKIAFEPQDLSLPNFAMDRIKEASLLSKGNHNLKLNYKSKTKEFKLDPKLMKFIFNNLLSNAIKYSPNGGIVEINISNARKNLIIKVSDEGNGIAKEDINKIFDSFYRTKNTEGISGTGLGLSIVKRAVDLHNGEITVDSELNKGTTFTVKIPI